MRQFAAELVLASRPADLPAPRDGVTTELDAPDVLAADARAARESGFGGEPCIQPRQVEVVGRAWRPSAEELAWARAVLADGGGGGGVGAVGARWSNRPLVQHARALLADSEG